MKRKLTKRLTALLLSALTVVSALPFLGWGMRVRAAEGSTAATAAGEEFMRIFHLDCGRKYFSVDEIKGIIDQLSANHYTHLQLAFGNDGFRFLLDDMSVGNYTSDKVKNAITSGNSTYANTVANKFSTLKNQYGSLAVDSSILSQDDMDTILSYAASKNIEVIPLLNTPGHSTSLISAMWTLGISVPTIGSQDVSASFDTKTYPAAAEFMTELVGKYAKYFADKGSKYFNVGADECDFASMKNNTSKYTAFAEYLNGLNAVVKKNGIKKTLAFNDGINRTDATTTTAFDTDVIVCYWTNGDGYASTTELSEAGFKIINTNNNWYYVLGDFLYKAWTAGQWGYSDSLNGIKSTPVNVVKDNSGITPVGSMLCMWCDGPFVSYDSTCQTNVYDLIKTMAEKNPTYFTESGGNLGETPSGNMITINLGATKPLTIEGKNLKNENYMFAPEGVASVVSIEGTDATEGSTVLRSKVSMSSDGTYTGVITDGTNYMVIDDSGNIISTTDPEKATEFTVVRTSSSIYWETVVSYKISGSGRYLEVTGYGNYTLRAVKNKESATSFRHDSLNGFYYQYNINSTKYYLTNSNSTWSFSTTGKTSLYGLTKSDPTPASTTITFRGDKIGTTVFTIGGVEYAITVKDDKIYFPVKFIDYRSDGMLFDFQAGGASYPYGFIHAGSETDDGYTNSNPNGGTLSGTGYGTKISGTMLENTGYVSSDSYTGMWYFWSGTWSRSGLVESKLQNGLPVYTKATVQYVASLIKAQVYNSKQMANVDNSNDIVYNTFVKNSDFADGSADDMSAAFAVAQTWNNIKCPYDLAYYLLNNLFVEDRATTTINGKTMPINGMYVDKYDSLVLTSDGNGYYTIDSKNALRYDKDSRTIYEKSDSTDNTYTGNDTKQFFPLDGLGYDADDYFGDTTDMTTGRNGNFAMVSEAQFVYNPNQYFTFSGDEDVYLYINGVLALDLGGAHGVCTKTVKLSDVAAKCGLTASKVADFKFFYMERNSSASNFSIKTNIELATPAISVDKKAYNATNGIEVNSGSALHTSVDVIYDLMVTNKGNLPMTDISFVDTDNCGNRIEFNGTESKFVNGNNSKAVINAGGPFTAWIQISDTAVRNEQTCADLAEVTAYLTTVELAPGETLHIKGIRCNLTPDNNSVFKYENNLNAKGTAGGIDLAGTAMHEIYSFEINDTSRAYVVDFGLPLRITELFDSNVAATALVTDVKLAKDQTFRYGTVELVGNKTDAQLIYTLNKTIHGAEVITLDIELTITLADGTQIKLPTAQKHITIIPATTVYYEDTFSDFIRFEGSGCSWETEGTTVSKEQSADRIAHSGNVYGHDQAYETMSKFSLGSAHKVTVSGGNYATAKFSFYGTGFDVISATTNTSGTIVVSVTGANGYSKNYLVDTYYGYTYDSVTGKWTPAPNDAKALWQIPVMKVANLDYGKYDVTITVAYADFFAHGQNGGGSYDFWLDAVRIYDPAGAVAGAAGGSQENYENAYKTDGECWPTYMELRDMIIRDKSFAVDSAANGMIFIDGQTGNVSMADYTSYGPNNELYLANGQAVAFRLNAAGNVADIQIALKNIVEGKNASCKIFAVGSEPENGTVLATATDMYRSIKDLNGKTVVIMNVGDADSILSITNLKVTYSEKPGATDTLSLTMDEKSALAALSAVDEVLNPKTPFEPGKVDVRVEDKDITVITSPDVDGIEIDGEKVTDFTVDSETGNRIWKKPIDRILKDNPEISVVARDSNGNVSAPVTAPVVAGGSIGALIGGFIGRLIKNILSVLFG